MEPASKYDKPADLFDDGRRTASHRVFLRAVLSEFLLAAYLTLEKRFPFLWRRRGCQKTDSDQANNRSAQSWKNGIHLIACQIPANCDGGFQYNPPFFPPICSSP